MIAREKPRSLPRPQALAKGITGRWPRHNRIFGLGEETARFAIDEHRVSDSASRDVHDLNACSFRCEVAITESEHGDEHGLKVASLRSQPVFVTRWALAVAMSLQHACLGES